MLTGQRFRGLFSFVDKILTPCWTRLPEFRCVCPDSLVNVDVIVPLLGTWKEEGRIRYLGVTHHEPVYFAPIERWIERGDLDFIQVRYSIYEPKSEQAILDGIRTHYRDRFYSK